MATETLELTDGQEETIRNAIAHVRQRAKDEMLDLLAEEIVPAFRPGDIYPGTVHLANREIAEMTDDQLIYYHAGLIEGHSQAAGILEDDLGFDVVEDEHGFLYEYDVAGRPHD